jgi:hypothetical protein
VLSSDLLKAELYESPYLRSQPALRMHPIWVPAEIVLADGSREPDSCYAGDCRCGRRFCRRRGVRRDRAAHQSRIAGAGNVFRAEVIGCWSRPPNPSGGCAARTTWPPQDAGLTRGRGAWPGPGRCRAPDIGVGLLAAQTRRALPRSQTWHRRGWGRKARIRCLMSVDYATGRRHGSVRLHRR